ncbi:MAG: eucyl/phenylalanyl-tRNA--protein transferase [Deltaproteobacteria bacterium]|jgi:leucyl/phenylalanyl-tRNA--protein transferase|nr:eucyl/phenylalanyl-tRNA--protein transferase [Deltaproteobacteria bacterium]
MPIFRLVDEPIFPPPDYADASGLLAVGGDLSCERLLEAYRLGIFPWYSDDQPILWWSPDPRLVLRLDEFKVSRSLRQTLKKDVFKVTFDRAFEEVIRGCASAPRQGQRGTWITKEMQEAYIELHGLGFAHSVETWWGEELAGGLYGVSLGKAFFGESMFHRRTDASKVALAVLVETLQTWGFHFIDAQMTTEHLLRFGAAEMPRRVFLKRLQSALRHPTKRGKWRIEN